MYVMMVWVVSLCQVLELLTHVSKRVKSRPAVQLPVEQLLAQFTDPASPATVVVTNKVTSKRRILICLTCRTFH